MPPFKVTVRKDESIIQKKEDFVKFDLEYHIY